MYVISDELYHFGIKGQKWGVRRFQNADGTRTAAGKKREQQLAARRLTKLYKDSYDSRFPLKTSDEFKKEAKALISTIPADKKMAIDQAKKKERAAWKKLDEKEFENSKEYKEFRKKVYDRTIKEYKKWDPSGYEEMVADAKKNGITNYLRYNRFDKFHDGVMDEMYESHRNQYNKNHPELKVLETKWEDAFRSANKIRSEAYKDLLGEYGDVKIKYAGRDTGYTLNSLLSDY